jgi:dUTPase
MAIFINNMTQTIMNTLLTIYDRVMVLRLYVDVNDINLIDRYREAANEHNNKLFNNPYHIDAGFDLFAPGAPDSQDSHMGDPSVLRFYGPGWANQSPVNRLNLRVSCSARIFTDTGKIFDTGYYMHPRSSLSRTPLRLANSTGIIDAGYRGHLMGMFDVVNRQSITQTTQSNNTQDADFVGQRFDRFLQICAPGLVPILVEVVNDINELGEETQRGTGGFGSTGR